MNQRGAVISIVDLLASVSEPVRLRTLRLLEAEELSVGEVAKVLQLPQSTVSRHLKVLADSAWLARRSAGTATLYRLVLDDLSPTARGLWLAIRGEASAAEAEQDQRRLAAVLAERKLDSQAFFGRVAGEWDEVRARLFGTGFTAPALLSLLSPRWTVADLGCGTGNVAELLAPHVERVVAVDQSEPMLEAARRRLGGTSSIELVRGALEALPLPDASVDAAVCALVLHHVARPEAALAEMRRVLRPERGGGVALVVDMAAHQRQEYRASMGHVHLGFSARSLAEMFAAAGFPAPPRVVALPSDPEGKGPGLLAATARL